MEGETDVRHNGIHEVARAGDVVAVMPYQEHGFFTEDNKKIKYWMALFSEDFMSDIVFHESASFGYKSLVFTPSPELKALIEAKMFDTQEEIIEPDFESILDIKSIIYATFSEQLRKKPSDLYIKSDNEKMASSTPVTKTMNYLKMNFQRDVSIEDCAKQIGYSESYVSHSLKKNLHITFLEARNNIRISYAKYLLRFKKMSIYMVGFECGFNSELTFKRVFKQLTNMTPQQFRKKYGRKHSK